MSQVKLPRWKCHKVVEADQIVATTDIGDGCKLHLRTGTSVLVDPTWLQRHNVKIGGYYVVYEDGYASFSPRDAFERGYAPITPHPPHVASVDHHQV